MDIDTSQNSHSSLALVETLSVDDLEVFLMSVHTASVIVERLHDTGMTCPWPPLVSWQWHRLTT
jgi:hypothetical protein